MPPKIPSQDPRAAYRRKVMAARRAGVGNRCACGESRPEAFIPGTTPIICAKCDRRKHNRTEVDDHHVFGEANNPLKMSVPVEDHRAVLSVDQYDWPRKTLENSDASPFLASAATIRGFVSTVVYLMYKHLLPVASMLELLDTMLERKLGKKWWKRTKLRSFEPRR